MELKILKQLEIELLCYIIGGIKMLEDVLNFVMKYAMSIIIIIKLMEKR